jgi:hypothetical protein
MLLFFDAVGRRQFFRYWPKTVKAMEKFYSNSTSNKDLPSKGF